MTVKNPFVSVICPAFNAEQTLETAYESLGKQGIRDWEFLVIDNGSEDGTLTLAEKLAENDDRVIVLREPIRGVSSARNRGIEASRGMYVTFLDADDALGHDSLKSRIQALERHPDVELAYCQTEMVGPSFESLNWVLTNVPAVTFANAFGSPSPIHAILGRGTFMRRFRFPLRSHAEDWLFIARMLRTGATLIRADDCVVYYRQNSDSAVLSRMLTHERGCFEALDLIYGRDPEVESAPEWVEGLQEPPLVLTKGRRAIRLLSHMLLAGDEEKANLALGMITRIGFSEPSAHDSLNAIRIAAARAQHIPRESSDARLYPAIARMASTAQAIGLPHRYPAYYRVIEGLLAPLVPERPAEALPTSPIPYALFPTGPFPSGVAYFDVAALLEVASNIENGTALVAGIANPDLARHFAHQDWSVHVVEPRDQFRALLSAMSSASWRLALDPRILAQQSGDVVHLAGVPASPRDPGNVTETVAIDRYMQERSLRGFDVVAVGSGAQYRDMTLAGFSFGAPFVAVATLDMDPDELIKMMTSLEQARYGCFVIEEHPAWQPHEPASFRGIRPAESRAESGWTGWLIAVPAARVDRFAALLEETGTSFLHHRHGAEALTPPSRPTVEGELR